MRKFPPYTRALPALVLLLLATAAYAVFTRINVRVVNPNTTNTVYRVTVVQSVDQKPRFRLMTRTIQGQGSREAVVRGRDFSQNDRIWVALWRKLPAPVVTHLTDRFGRLRYNRRNQPVLRKSWWVRMSADFVQINVDPEVGFEFVIPLENSTTPWDLLDDDGDGVLNGVDQCPSVAGPASNNGCPMVNPTPTFDSWGYTLHAKDETIVGFQYSVSPTQTGDGGGDDFFVFFQASDVDVQRPRTTVLGTTRIAVGTARQMQDQVPLDMGPTAYNFQIATRDSSGGFHWKPIATNNPSGGPPQDVIIRPNSAMTGAVVSATNQGARVDYVQAQP